MKGKARRNGIDGYDITLVEEVTLRDRFAMAALQGMNRNDFLCNGSFVAVDGMASEAYITADAMLKARASKEGE